MKRNLGQVEIRKKMLENGMNQRELAKLMQRSISYLTLRLTGKDCFDLRDVYNLSRILDIPLPEEFTKYFPL